ncbi:KDO2-lipid IV(A) lauroyltransferase [Rhodoblastus sphagnicola]|nr:lysophospholipid acyltransferase family protein [Rhodoblastus sphagnicola]MBB4196508.1 KDO2-lipid IV(A) lauroyltransferase [Rhodoblastus sphagnicola]
MRQIRHWLEFAGFRVMGLLFSVLPVEAASKFGGALVAWLGPKSKKRHPRLLRNIRTALPELSESEAEKLAVEVWRNLGFVLGEFFHLEEIARDRVEVSDPEGLRALAHSGKGVVLCSAHYANWEGAGAVLTEFGFKPLGVYHPFSNALVDRHMLDKRLKYYAGGLMAKRDPETPLAMIRYARQGGCIAFLVDQQVHMGLQTPFFGRPAQSTPFPAMVARQCGIPLLLIMAERLPGVHFRVRSRTIDVPHTNDRNADIFAATAAMQAGLERTIREHPEQWMWTHDRWK